MTQVAVVCEDIFLNRDVMEIVLKDLNVDSYMALLQIFPQYANVKTNEYISKRKKLDEVFDIEKSIPVFAQLNQLEKSLLLRPETASMMFSDAFYFANKLMFYFRNDAIFSRLSCFAQVEMMDLLVDMIARRDSTPLKWRPRAGEAAENEKIVVAFKHPKKVVALKRCGDKIRIHIPNESDFWICLKTQTTQGFPHKLKTSCMALLATFIAFLDNKTLKSTACFANVIKRINFYFLISAPVP